MYSKIRGVVLNSIKYSDNKLITNIFTENFGSQAFILNISRSKNAVFRTNIIQPLSILDIEVSYKPNKEFQHIKDCKPFYIYKSVYYDIIKSTIVLFLTEVLYKSIRSENANESLFNFLLNFMIDFDSKAEDYNNYHIYFLLELMKYIGFYPYNNYSEEHCFFDLKEGNFASFPPNHKNYLDPIQSKIMSDALNLGIKHQIVLSHDSKKNLLYNILLYYKFHIIGFKEVKSHKILEDVLA
ncbi:MAG: DNA repair protein RecO [Bacteroidota bacterium]|nr:DNA repair protein RecO [Bacteroidota bacterium]